MNNKYYLINPYSYAVCIDVMQLINNVSNFPFLYIQHHYIKIGIVSVVNFVCGGNNIECLDVKFHALNTAIINIVPASLARNADS